MFRVQFVVAALAVPGMAFTNGRLVPASSAGNVTTVHTQSFAEQQTNAFTKTVDAILDDLWGGMDFRQGIFSFNQLANAYPSAAVPVERNVHVFGLQNSGVDLIKALLYINFGYRLNYYGMEPGELAGLWKHSNIKAKFQNEPDTFAKVKDKEVYAILMIRNPLSWLQATRRAPHLFKSCVSGDDWLNKSCIHDMPGGYNSSIGKVEYSSIAGVWNEWNKGYDDALHNGFPHRIVVAYETLVRSPETVMKRIGTFLGVKKPSVEVDAADALGGRHGVQDSAYNNVFAKRYMELFSADEKAQACSKLDGRLLDLYTYGEDCRNVPALSSSSSAI